MMQKIRLCAFADEADKYVDGQIKALHRNNIEFVEVRGVDGINVSEISRKKAKEVADKFGSEGISVWSIGSPIGKFPIDRDFNEQTELLRRVIETADIMGAKCIRIFSFYGTNGLGSYKDQVIERLAKFAEIARDSGVMLCCENEKGVFGDSVENCLEIHKNISDIKCVFDPANFVQCGQDTLKAWEALKPFVYYGHVKDALSSGTVVPAGKGDGHIAEYVREFAGLASDVLTVEPHLKEFCGLASLEEKENKSIVGELKFDTADDAFDFAVGTFKQLLDTLGIGY